MNKYAIGFIRVVVLFLGSAFYKQQYMLVYYHFPVPEELKKQSTGSLPLYLFLFFSKNDCASFLQKVIGVLNRLPAQFCIAGAVTLKELEDEDEGKIIFVLPGITGQCAYLENFIKSIYGKLILSLRKKEFQ